MHPPLPSQRYLSTRGGSYDLPFEEVVLKGLASDGGLFIPEEIPSITKRWGKQWLNWPYTELAVRIFSLYISQEDIPPYDLLQIVEKSYSSFRSPVVTPLVTLDEEKRLHLLELFHGETFAFKDVALQFLGNVLEYFLVRRNKDRPENEREHLTIIGATSGDTGSAAIYGLRRKRDLSIMIMFPGGGKVSEIQEAQMTTVLDENVHSISVADGSFDTCQDFVKALFGDTDINRTHKLGAVNSINWARILAQITYYFHAYSTLTKSKDFKEGDEVRFVVPTGNFGDILAGYFAKEMGLPIKLVCAVNENDILHRFWQSGYYEKKPVHGQEANGGFVEDGVKAHADGVRETYSPAMDILVSSNFERLLWFLAFQDSQEPTVEARRKAAGERVQNWLHELKTDGGFGVEPAILKAAKVDFESERVSDAETIATIKDVFQTKSSCPAVKTSKGTKGTVSNGGYILDPHTAIGVAAAKRTIERAEKGTHHIALATAHPAKFSKAVEKALEGEEGFVFEDILPEELVGIKDLPRRVTEVRREDGLEGLRKLIRERVPAVGEKLQA
ncbi:MAG: hypothetical protein LQ350_006816 [Teloschistes chrysophthalmus]|nr:MAG: hypothetical protein LQ350_006816 [Niorma chrysophthalma]